MRSQWELIWKTLIWPLKLLGPHFKFEATGNLVHIKSRISWKIVKLQSWNSFFVEIVIITIVYVIVYFLILENAPFRPIVPYICIALMVSYKALLCGLFKHEYIPLSFKFIFHEIHDWNRDFREISRKSRLEIVIFVKFTKITTQSWSERIRIRNSLWQKA